MQLKITTDYAIRCVLYLANQKGVHSNAQICAAMGIPESYLPKIMKILKEERIVDAVMAGPGKSGYCIGKRAENITLLDIILPMEKTIRINRCLMDDGYCSRNGPEHDCSVHAYYQGLQQIIETYLASMTVADVISGRKNSFSLVER